MKHKLPKQPKPKKLPKKPKQSASLQVWRNWKHKRDKTISDNAQALAAWKRVCEKIHKDEKERQALIRSASK